MPVFKAYKLHFSAPLHIGDAKGDYSISQQTIQSDSMYAALTSCLAKLGETIPVGGDLGFTISSLFPFYQEKNNSKAVFFLPKPMKQQLPTLQNIGQAKAIKKVAWLDTHFFERAIEGETLFENDSDIRSIKKSFCSEADIDSSFIVSQGQERVAISRTGKEDAVPYFVDKVVFKGRSGLYFLAIGDCSLLDKALTLLQYEGIGTDRNVGNGLFSYETEEIELKLPDRASAQMSLSMFIPESEEQLKTMTDGTSTAYDIARRGGWITTPPFNTIRKNYIYSFTPASIFSSLCNTEVEIKGSIVDLANGVPMVDHPIYRCGKAIFIPINV